jgi:AraC-like DNA-binding protein
VGDGEEAVTADDHGLELRITSRPAGSIQARACGEVALSTAPALRRGLAKLLADGVPVLLDVSQLRLTWPPGPELFVTAVAAAGGWPVARLVLFGADPETTDRLRAFRVPDVVPLATTAAEAAARMAARPTRVTCWKDFRGEPASVQRARDFLSETCRQWLLPEQGAAEAVVTELAERAVEDGGSGFRLRLVLDTAGLRMSVQDGCSGEAADVVALRPSPARAPGPEGHDLPTVERLSRSWGVLHYDIGTTVWALVPVAPDVPTSRSPTPHLRRRGRAGGSIPHVTRVRRRHYTTGDPERADEFLRAVYGAHAFHLAGADIDGFHLDYDGVATNCFAVERLSHAMAVDGLLAPAEALVVVHTLAGDVCISTRDEEQSAAPGEILLIDAGAGCRFRGVDAEMEVVRLDRSAVVQLVAEVTGVDPASVRFDMGRPISPGRAEHWRATLRHLRHDVLGNDEVMAGPLSRDGVLRNLVTMLLETFPNPVITASTEAADVGRGSVPPMTVRRAVRFIEDHVADDIGLTEIAAAARIGPRALQLAFRRHHDLTPLEYLRQARLDRAHRELQAATIADTTVAAVAARWGFPHHSNFSAAYLRTYGCSPSITLRS